MKHERIYLNKSDDRVYIDTYVANENRARDAMLVIPGGGYWDVCHQREGEPIAIDFLSKGYNCFVLNYRVGRAGDAFPSQLIDAGTAMIYIREHAEELKVNPKRVFAVGFSAGGHLCGSMASMYAYPEIMEAFGEKYKMVKPTAAILSYPVTVMTGPAHIDSFKNLLARRSAEFTEEEINRYSLERVVNSDTAPMYLWHTVEDSIVPIQGTILLAHALTEAKVNYRLSVFPYGEHGMGLGSPVTANGVKSFDQPMAAVWTKEADEWMQTLPDSEY